MKMRTVSIEPPEVDKAHDPWKKYPISLLTPLYGGGVEPGNPDHEVPVRASSIRGQLRFWWRVLNPRAGFAAERRLWGGMSEEGRDHSSKVWIRIKNISWNPGHSVVRCAEYGRANGRYRGYPAYRGDVSQYALFPARGKLNDGRTAIEEQPRHIIIPPLNFELQVRADDEQYENTVQQVLRWWTSFGGLGARTRRGLGSIETSDLAIVTREEVERAGGKLVIRGHEADSSPIVAWKRAVERLWYFRQGEDVGRRYSNGRPGRSLWPEPDSIRLILGGSYAHPPARGAEIAFPRAIFGLPIIFHFKDRGDPPTTLLTPLGAERMASPLILRAYPLGNGRYAPAALLLPGYRRFINGLSLTLKREAGGEVRRFVSPVDWQPGQPGSIPALNGRGDDALQAFMSFFGER